MRNTLKAVAFVAMLTVGVGSVALAHPDTSEKSGITQELVLKNFEHSLGMRDYPGVVESTIYNVVVFKNRFPQLDYARVASMLQRLAEQNQDASLSYKAELAYLYLNLNGGLDLDAQPGSADHGYIFKQISEQLAQKFLAAQQ